MKIYLLPIFLACLALFGPHAYAGSGDPDRYQAQYSTIYDESRDPASMSCFLAAGYATAAAEVQEPLRHYMNTDVNFKKRISDACTDSRAGTPGRTAAMQAAASEMGSAAGVVDGPPLGVGSVIPVQLTASLIEGVGIAALPGVDDAVVDAPQKDIAWGPPDGAGIQAAVRQPGVLPPDRIVPGGQGRRQQGRQDTNQDHAAHTYQYSRSPG